MRTEFFHVDSKHREGGTFGTAPNYYKWKFPHTVRGVHRVEVLHAEIPNSQYNVPEGNTFSFEISVFSPPVAYTAYTFSIPAGNYTYSTLETALNALTLYTLGIEVILDNTEGRISLLCRSDIALGGVALPQAVRFLPGACSRCFGISSTFQSLVTSCKSYNVVQLYATHAFFLRIPELGQTHNNIHTSGAMYSSNRPGVIGRFQNVAGPFEVNHYRDDLQVYYKTTNPSFLLNLTEITIEWIDTDGYGVDFNGADHSFFLKVTYEDQ
jgi:hypothetical protein